jgi:hypothetical protein
VKNSGKAAIRIVVTEGERDEVARLAKQRGYGFTSDYIRALIEADSNAHGSPVKFEVDRGGYRERKEDAED